MRRGRSGSLRTWIVSCVPSGATPFEGFPSSAALPHRCGLLPSCRSSRAPLESGAASLRPASLQADDSHRVRSRGAGSPRPLPLAAMPGTAPVAPTRVFLPCRRRLHRPLPVARCAAVSRRPTSRRRVAPTTVATCARRDRDGAFPPGCPGHELRRYPQDPFAVRLFRAVRRGPPCASPVRPRLPETVPRHPDLFRSPSSRGGSSAPSGRPPRSTVRSRRLPVLLRYRPVRAVASADFRVFLHRRVRCVIRPCELDDARSFHGFVSRSRSSPPSAGASALAGVRSPVRSCGAGPSCLGPTRPSYGSVRGLGS